MMTDVEVLKISSLGGLNMKAVCFAGYCIGFNISFTFEAVKNLYAHPTNLRFGLFFGDFWIYLGTNSFSQRISKIDGKGEF